MLVAFALAAASCGDGETDEATAGESDDSATVESEQAAETAEEAPEDESALADDAEAAPEEAADDAGSSEPGSDELCAAFVELSSTSGGLEAANLDDSQNAKETLERFAAALENLENVADDPRLAADAAIVSTPMQEIIALYEAADWDLEAVASDPAAVDSLVNLGSPEVIEATDRIAETGRTRCGVDLDA